MCNQNYQLISYISSVTSIENLAFNECSKIKKITIPSSLASIGDYAFNECSSLTQIKFENPFSITSIGVCAFEGCSSLKQNPILSFINEMHHLTILLSC